MLYIINRIVLLIRYNLGGDDLQTDEIQQTIFTGSFVRLGFLGLQCTAAAPRNLFATSTLVPSSTPFPTATDTQQPTATFTVGPTETATPTVTPGPPPTPGPALALDTLTLSFFDDFSNPESGWDRLESTDYANGGYRIFIDMPRTRYWARPYLNFEDVVVEVDARLVGGGDDNSLGVICKHQDDENFYALMISSDGFFAIRKRFQGSELLLLSGTTFIPSEAINTEPGATNRLRAECIGGALRLYVNLQPVAEVFDNDIVAGDVGLIASTFDADTTDILFDNFVAYVP